MAQTLDCGQAFRWRQLDDGRWQGAAGGRILTLGQASGPQGVTLTFYHTDPADFEAFWRRYFDLDRDYPAIPVSYTHLQPYKNPGSIAAGARRLKNPMEAICIAETGGMRVGSRTRQIPLLRDLSGEC